ncbi:hypothetical protein TBLA_0D03200 [Henningerozyma blattae CBS 6284]|uniref:intramembrane prenyl-peptidase Rce1 n=1 Tax=Henningerozyma blattae (strain ATCC 34711 / CBS 6284 / DSM 70876 / NBRC 10599 / NRRL Y-10934 / UCD 77-7) TaxID=1071380 RepID=I2H368_HENB6|nr:hypothetical protein TBLA_0D03200 [Tetrapisispora blattae CBS 6284]CCH60820.1 hypothetical protein TBLA_0D03200 [Tetrapisispora blattae CBS 6284]
MTSNLSLILSLYISISYVIVLYFTEKGMENYPAQRDDPRVIRLRMKRIYTLMGVNLILIPLIQSTFNKNLTFWQAFKSLGIIPSVYYNSINHSWNGTHAILFIKQTISTLSLISSLYIGILIDNVLFYYLIKDSNSIMEDLKEEIHSIWGVRNYIFAPITEEVFYTSMILTSYLSLNDVQDLTMKQLLILPPIFFGFAHLHHAYSKIQMGTISKLNVILNSMFQFIYTTIFGILTNFIFLKTNGNLWCCIILHSYCNYMGFPQGSELANYFLNIKVIKNEKSIKYLTIWKKIYLMLLLIGILLFKNGISYFNSLPESITV